MDPDWRISMQMVYHNQKPQTNIRHKFFCGAQRMHLDHHGLLCPRKKVQLGSDTACLKVRSRDSLILGKRIRHSWPPLLGPRGGHTLKLYLSYNKTQASYNRSYYRHPTTCCRVVTVYSVEELNENVRLPHLATFKPPIVRLHDIRRPSRRYSRADVSTCPYFLPYYFLTYYRFLAAEHLEQRSAAAFFSDPQIHRHQSGRPL